MSEPVEAPHGSWSSPITAAMVAADGVGLDEVSIVDGVVYWLESRASEGGRLAVVRGDAWSSPVDVTPASSNVRSKVHEYGGGAYWVDRAAVFYVNFDDQRLYRLVAGEEPEAITPETDGRDRYADGRLTRDGSLVICVRERHEGSSPREVVNELVAIPADGSGPPRTIAGGRDFFAAPRVSPDGARLAWLCWDLPNMPFDGCELHVADIEADGTLANDRIVAGGSHESIFQPEWSPSGDLHFISDRTGWWNLYRERSGEVEALLPMEAEFGWPMWQLGASSYAFLGDGRIACEYSRGGSQHVAVLDPGSGELVDLDLPHTAIEWPSIAAEGMQIAFVGAAPDLPAQVVSLDFSTRALEVLRESRSLSIDPSMISVPSAIEFPTDGGLTAHAFFYPPTNPNFRAGLGELPPLVVMSHGGPTGQTTAAFDIRTQLFTSRGFAVVDVNYGGSSGFGRAYRERLLGNWGVVDTMDCVNAARYLADRGMVDGARMAIRGGSAGGYATLCAITFHDTFAAGASYFGIADLEALAVDTHKFESGYEEGLVGPYPAAADIYRARSPIHFVHLISCPMIVFQGTDDRVVPPEQAEMMVAALQAKGLAHAYVSFEGEGHGFRRSESIVRSLEAELSFYAQIFGFLLADPVEPVEIRNLVESR